MAAATGIVREAALRLVAAHLGVPGERIVAGEDAAADESLLLAAARDDRCAKGGGAKAPPPFVVSSIVTCEGDDAVS